MLRLRGLQLSASLRRAAPGAGRTNLLAAASGPRLTLPLRRAFAKEADEDFELQEDEDLLDLIEDDEEDFDEAPRQKKPPKHRRSWQAQLRAQWPDTGDDAVYVENKEDPNSDSYFEYRPTRLSPMRPMKPFKRGELRRLLRAAYLARDDKTFQELEDWLSWGIYKKPSSKTPEWWMTYAQAKTEEAVSNMPPRNPSACEPYYDMDPFAEYHLQDQVVFVDKRDKEELKRFRDLRKNWEALVDPQIKLAGRTPEEVRARLADPARREAARIFAEGGRMQAHLEQKDIDAAHPRLAITHINNPGAQLPNSFDDPTGALAVAEWQKFLMQREAYRALHGENAEGYPLPDEKAMKRFLNALAPRYAAPPRYVRMPVEDDEEEDDMYEEEEEEEYAEEMEEDEYGEGDEEDLQMEPGPRKPRFKWEKVLSPQRVEAPHGELSELLIDELNSPNPAPFVKELLKQVAEARGTTVEEALATMNSAAEHWRAAASSQVGELSNVLLRTQAYVAETLSLLPALTKPTGEPVLTLTSANLQSLRAELAPDAMKSRAEYWEKKMPPEWWFTGIEGTAGRYPTQPSILMLHPGNEFMQRFRKLADRASRDKAFAARVADADAELAHLFETGKVTWQDYIERAKEHLRLYALQRRSELAARLYAFKMSKGRTDDVRLHELMSEVGREEEVSVDDVFTRLADVRRTWMQLVPPRTLPPKEFFKEIWVIDRDNPEAEAEEMKQYEDGTLKKLFEEGKVTMDDFIDKVRLEIRERVVANIADERGIPEDAVRQQWDRMWEIVESMTKPEMYNADELRAEDHQLRLKQIYENDPIRQNAIVEAKERALDAAVKEFMHSKQAAELDKRFKSEHWLPPLEYAHLRIRSNENKLPVHPLNLWWDVPMTEFEETLMESLGHDDPGPYARELEEQKREAESTMDRLYYRKPEPYHDAFVDDRQFSFQDGKVLEEHEKYMMSRRIDPDELDEPLPKAPPEMYPSDEHIKLSEETKNAIWALHTRDPGKWHPRALAAHFHMSLDLIEMVLVERSCDEAAAARGDDVHFLKDWLDAYRAERDYVWLPPVAHNRYLEPKLMFVSEYDKYRIDKLEAKRKEFLLAEHERKMKAESEFYAQNGPLGTPPKPELPPQYIPGAPVHAPRKYHTVLTDISDKKNARYRIAVRDRIGVLRQPTRAEFWKVRYREKPKQDKFTPVYYDPHV